MNNSWAGGKTQRIVGREEKKDENGLGMGAKTRMTHWGVGGPNTKK